MQEHSINNGLLFRSNLHKLFDAGFVTVTPGYRFEVSTRIKGALVMYALRDAIGEERLNAALGKLFRRFRVR